MVCVVYWGRFFFAFDSCAKTLLFERGFVPLYHLRCQKGRALDRKEDREKTGEKKGLRRMRCVSYCCARAKCHLKNGMRRGRAPGVVGSMMRLFALKTQRQTTLATPATPWWCQCPVPRRGRGEVRRAASSDQRDKRSDPIAFLHLRVCRVHCPAAPFAS